MRPRACSATPGGDEQRTVRAFERGAERFDRVPVGLAIFRELREVVVEGGVDHAVRRARAATQAIKIFERPAMDSSAGGGERRTDIGAREAEHLMPIRDQFLNDSGAYESSRTSNKDAHEEDLRLRRRHCRRSAYPGKVVTLYRYNH